MPWAVVRSAPPDSPCLPAAAPLPAERSELSSVTVVSREAGTCLDYAAVQVFIDASSRIVAVDLSVGEP
ncbi:hypothetical protein [Nocardioides sp. cx-173]|uniref:hypothetical protein n=1 Tax=Nocardioides sp. cx-173 TaxID=2898796 RepID=UPI001E330404|nr:hypothetical protein [Nocardioides sp. cx-173]MCD4524317.1 hypothetical protein [Nocardioides sp. cx-173]UGB41708.1 hypothetical protein LQ940_20420 [Nocardioides sp. cx-173]